MFEGYTSTDHSLCHQEYSQLKREFDTYKSQIAAASNSVTSVSSGKDELEYLKRQLAVHKEKVTFLTNELEQTQADHKLLMVEQKNVSSCLSLIMESIDLHLKMRRINLGLDLRILVKVVDEKLKLSRTKIL